MVALQAAIELRGRLVAAPGLQEPPLGLVVAALWAINLGSRKGAELVLLVPDDLDRGGDSQLLFGRLGDGGRGLVGETAVVADVEHDPGFAVLVLLQPKPGAALGTELQPDPPPRAFWTLV